MKNLKIDYKKSYGNDGTVYSQTITTTKEIIKKYNEYVEKTKEAIHKNFVLSNENLKSLTYLKPLQYNINYLHLTELNHFKRFYLKEIYQPPKKDIDFERILWRNTIIKT